MDTVVAGNVVLQIDTQEGEEVLTLMSPAGVHGTAFIPASSFCIGGREHIIALRDALNEVFPVEE